MPSKSGLAPRLLVFGQQFGEPKRTTERIDCKMKNKVLKALAVTLLVGTTMVAQAVSFTGSINFSPNLTLTSPPGATLANVTQLTPNVVTPMQINTAPTGIYSTHGLAPLSFLTDAFMYPNSGSVLDLAGPGSFTVYKFTWGGSGTLYEYSLVSSGFSIVGQNALFLNIYGTGTAYIKYASGPNAGQDAFDPSAAIWTLTGTQTGTTAWGLSTTSLGIIPDGGTTLVLLGLALSGLGLIRNKLS